jgi:hypothetical protein
MTGTAATAIQSYIGTMNGQNFSWALLYLFVVTALTSVAPDRTL